LKIMMAPTLPADIADTVRRALAEDIGTGDLTAALIPADARGAALVITREAAVLCGTAWFDTVFWQLDGTTRIDWQARDGEHVVPGQVLCRLEGSARTLLTGERTALNFLQTLSGTATRAAAYARAVAHTQAQVLDTRKTLPCLRTAQKYATACGGAHNHRLGLYDGILIKENHIAAAGSIAAAVAQAQRQAPAGVFVEIEVEDLAQLREALAAGARRILLDNFDLAALPAIVREARGRATLEASGGVTLENIAAVAETGVDFISIGEMTKNVRAVDLSMRFV
jgi:nicotinate-nucleotide pyrophosphorylase (carboxylating)